MTIIYGIDTKKPFTAKDARDAIVECFVEAHKEQLDDLKNYQADMNAKDFEEIKRINVRQLIRHSFAQTDGDYDNPTKESIMAVLGSLKEFAANFRNQKIVEKHYGEIKRLIDLLKQ